MKACRRRVQSGSHR